MSESKNEASPCLTADLCGLLRAPVTFETGSHPATIDARWTMVRGSAFADLVAGARKLTNGANRIVMHEAGVQTHQLHDGREQFSAYLAWETSP